MTNKKMEISHYGPGESNELIQERTQAILSSIPAEPSKDILNTLFSLIDLTTLNTQDNSETARQITGKVNHFSDSFPDYPNVAAICVYPLLVEHVKAELQVEGVQIAAVGAGFPSSQTFLSIKLAECDLLRHKGADEIDIVLPVGSYLEGDLQSPFGEIQLIKNQIQSTHLKVILETGLLPDAESIRTASLLAMEAGADFIKTSTGKVSPAATPEAVYVMLQAIKDYYEHSGRRVGIKPAGGIATVSDALQYYALVKEVLGDNWLNPNLFRIGASRLANNLLSRISGQEVNYF